MNFTELAPIASLVSAGAVLISLIYLSLQVRQTERNQRAAVNQAILDRHIRYAEWLGTPPLGAVHLRAMGGDVAFDDAEIAQMLSFVQALSAQALDAWVQRKSHLIDEPTYAMVVVAVRLLLSIPAYRAIWSIVNSIHGDEFGRFVEVEVLSSPLLAKTYHRDRYHEALKGLVDASDAAGF